MESPEQDLVRPAYGDASLADLMPGVLAALGVPGAPDPLRLAGQLEGVRRVAVLLVDGLGYHQLPTAAPVAPLLSDALAGRLGTLRTLTAGFPSTTPTSLVSLGTGVPPGAHGVVGFTVNLPGTDQVLNHIRWDTDPDPATWQPVPSRLAYAATAGVAVTVLTRTAYVGSGLTVSAYGPTHGGATYRPADDADMLATGMLAALAGAEPPALVYGYHPELDGAGHEFGVGSPQWRAAAATVDRLLARLVEGLPPDAALVVTADHGQVDVPSGRRFDLDGDPRLRAGVRLVAGEPRVRYLHTEPGAVDDVIAAWRGVLGDAASVVSREQMVADGWYGPVPAAHLPRLGDVVVTCRDRDVIVATAHESDRMLRTVAFHGSWTEAEMRIPLLLLRRDGAMGSLRRDGAMGS